MQKTTLYLPGKLNDRLGQLAKRTKKTKASLARNAIEQYVIAQEERTTQPKSFGSANNPNVDASNYEQWLQRAWGKKSN